MQAWFNVSPITKSPGPTSLAMVVRLVMYPLENTTASSAPLSRAIFASSSRQSPVLDRIPAEWGGGRVFSRRRWPMVDRRLLLALYAVLAIASFYIPAAPAAH
jgi:hypothetical protein